jgi:prepilin-type N-terminal cleavage/methylation domain-containing protein
VPRRRRVRILTRGRSGGFSLLELLIVLCVIAVVAAVAIPSLLASRLKSNEAAAVTTLRFVADAETQFKASSIVDLDHDGAGEYGYFKEMSAGTCVRATPNGSERGVFAAPAPLPPAYAALEDGGEFVRSGYRFRIFLPGAGGVGVGEPDFFPLNADIDAALAATAYGCYAWPTRHGTSGNRTFFVNQEQRIVGTDCDEYSGPRAITADVCGGAFGRGAGGLASIIGAIAAGTRGRDGNLWKREF